MPTEPQLASVTEYEDIEQTLKKKIPQSVQVSLIPKLSNNHVNGFSGFEVTRPIPYDEVREAVLLLNEALQPCPKDVAIKAMFALKVRTANTPADREIAEERIGLYLADLQSYPQDVVVSACRSIANQSPYFPAWANLLRELEWRVRKRVKMLEALNAI